MVQKIQPAHINIHQSSDNGRCVLPIVPQTLSDPLSQYALQLLHMRPSESPVDDVLREMEKLAARDGIPIIGPLEGAMIQMLIQLYQTPPRRVLDIGTAIGYSAIWLARGLPPESQITSIEIDPERAEMAQHFISQAGYQDRVRVLVGDVFELLPKIENQFDVILQDVIKHIYFGADSQLSLKLLDLCVEYLVAGGVLLGDNVFCMGEVLHEPSEQVPEQVIGIQAYNDRVASHPQLHSIAIPIRDGLWVSRKRANR